MSVQYLTGNIVDDDADIIVNTVNCVGVMGKGVALAFKQRWPAIMSEYRTACFEGRLAAGGCLLFPHPDGHPNRYWAALATKAHWRDASRPEWVEHGLTLLADKAGAVAARSIAIPPPGCGNGGLSWALVHPLVLGSLSDFDLHIYASPPQSNQNA